MPRFLFFIVFLIISNLSYSQKPPLDHSVYDDWQNIQNAKISNDGKWIFYTISVQEGDDTGILTTPKGTTLNAMPRANNSTFTEDSKHLIYLIKAPFQETRAAKIAKKKSDELPMDSLAIYSFSGKNRIKISDVKSYKIPEKSSHYLAYLKKKVIDSVGVDSLKSKSKKGKATFNLYVRNLKDQTERIFENIDSYNFSENGEKLFFIKKPNSKDTATVSAGLYLYDLSLQELKHIKRGNDTIKNVVFDKKGEQLAFVASQNLYYFKTDLDSAKVIVNNKSDGIPTNWSVSENGKTYFSEKGNKLFFGIAPTLPKKDTTLVDFETAKLDIWHWKDDYLQTQQLVNLKRDLNRSYLSVIYPNGEKSKVVQIEDEDLNNTLVTESNDNEYVVATSDKGRRIETQWQTGTYKEVFIVSTSDGSRESIAKDIRGDILLSPQGKYVLWFSRDTGKWTAYSISNGQTTVLNKSISVSFANEDNDRPDDATSYGLAGWLENNEAVLLNDKYDIWKFDLQNNKYENITQGKGRKNKITYRYVDPYRLHFKFMRNQNVILKSHPIYLSVFDHTTKENGIAEVTKNKKENLITRIKNNFSYKQLRASKKDGHFIFTKENFLQSPDLFYTNDFKNETRLSQINPQQDDYNWGTAELIEWTTPKGFKAEGVLYKPEDFDPNKKYPVITYFYEIVSNGLHTYIPPSPTPSRLNISYFVSNGYLVLAPDIRYEEGYPGQGAEEYINSGVDYIKKRSYVDGEHIGIQGQSWGGYQVAHLITRTNRYAAAWSGAPVVNMTSAYGGIRWQTGMSRQFQYEKTQSRIGETLWENPELYIENSPLFHLPKVETPVVVMANDEDGAVPWYQGIEFYTGLRRLQKPVWLLNYNGDAHNLVKRANKKDIQIRQKQFFDHYLKGKPAPIWLERGVPATLKGISWGLDLAK